MIDTYLSIAKPTSGKIKREGSRFLSFIYPVSSERDIKRIIDELRREYHAATHHCYAYRILGEDKAIVRTQDDREPAGSAGAPILQQLERARLYDVLAVVIRYFGGKKLGIGGLIRAYGDAANEAISRGKITKKQRQRRVEIEFPPELNSAVMGLLHRHPVQIEGMEYGEVASIRVRLPCSALSTFERQLREATSAKANLQEVE
jgi:uncharacterized YigZ family protein